MTAPLPPRLAQWLVPATSAGGMYGVDPHLVLAIIDRESLGGEALTPRGPTGTGDGGHGRGLMQLDDRAHPDLIARRLANGTPAWQDGPSNILMGTTLLAAELHRFHGDEDCAVAAYNAGPGAVRHALSQLTIPRAADAVRTALDALTTGGDYVSDVMLRRRTIRRALHLGEPDAA